MRGCDFCGATFSRDEDWHEHQYVGLVACARVLKRALSAERARRKSAERAIRVTAIRRAARGDDELPEHSEHFGDYPEAREKTP